MIFELGRYVGYIIREIDAIRELNSLWYIPATMIRVGPSRVTLLEWALCMFIMDLILWK